MLSINKKANIFYLLKSKTTLFASIWIKTNISILIIIIIIIIIITIISKSNRNWANENDLQNYETFCIKVMKMD